MIKLLSEKGFIFKTKNNRYVLSDSGKRLVKEIVENNKDIEEDNKNEWKEVILNIPCK